MAIKAFELFGDIELRTAKLKTGMREANKDFDSLRTKAKSTVDGVERDLGRMAKFKTGLNQGFMSSFGIQGGGGFGSLIGNAAGNLLQTGVKALTGVVKDAAQQGLDYADMLQRTKIGFINLLGDKEKGLSHVRELVKYGVESSFETADVLKFANSLEALKVKTSEVIPMLEGLGGWAAGAGNFDKMQNAVMAITQMLSKNKVSAEEMNQQLAEVTPDPYGMMMRGYESAGYKFKDRGEFQAKAEGGELNAQVAVRLMLAQARKEKGSLLEEIVGGTIQGQTAILNDKRSMLYALGMMGVDDLVADPTEASAYAAKKRNIATLSNLYDPQKSPQALKIAQNLGAGASNIFKVEDFLESQTFAEDNFGDTLRSAVSGDWKGAEESFKKMATTLGGYIPQGLKDGIAAGASAVSDTATSVMGSSVWDSLSAFWETNSPSERAKRLGRWIREGFDLGMNRQQAGNYANMKALSEKDPEFLRTLGIEAGKRGVNPDDMLNLIGIESSFNKSVMNKWGYGGLSQVGRKERASIGFENMSDAEFQKLLAEKSASWQLSNVTFPLLDQKLRENPHVRSGGITGAELYAMWGSGHATGDPNAVHMAKGGKRAAAYANNPLWDVNKDGVVREAEFGQAAMASLGAGRAFSVNGQAAVSQSNPMPVTIIDAGNGVDFRSGPSFYGDPTLDRQISNARGMYASRHAAQSQRSGTINDSVPVNVDVLIQKTEQPLKTFAIVLNENALQLKKLTPLLGDAATAAAGVVDPFKAIDQEFGGGFVTKKGDKKKKRDKLFGEALTWEGAAGDFQGGLQSALMDPFKKESWGNFGMGFLKDIQGRAAHDLSSSITQLLFGGRKDPNDPSSGLTGGLFGSLFGGFLGGSKKGWGDFKLPSIGGVDAGSGGGGFGGFFAKLFGSIFGGFRESGGGMSAGRFYVAGERGPEIVAGPGHVYNASQTRQMMSGGGGGREQRFIFVDSEREAQRHRSARADNFIMQWRANRHIISRFT
jgi:tape measure domain-containing protein